MNGRSRLPGDGSQKTLVSFGKFFVRPTPIDQQPTIRMNRDTLYMGIPIDTSKGYSITVPKHPDDRYVSVYVLDNEHMALHILRGSGVTHRTTVERCPTRRVRRVRLAR